MTAVTAWRRLRRVTATGSPATIGRAARRELWLRRERRALHGALASDERLIVGPFLGEVGYELLYWRPMVRRLLREASVARERVVIVTRGGAGGWYRDVAADAVDVLEVIDPEELRLGIERRVERTGQRKQVDVDAFDRTVLSRVMAKTGAAGVLHPLHLYWRFRFVWEGIRPPADALELGDYDPLPETGAEVPPHVAEVLPERYVAAKLYVNDCLPDGAETAARVRAMVRDVAAQTPVVLLETGIAVDDHDDVDAGGSGVLNVRGLIDPLRNLHEQAAIVARADALVSTYGGFSYLGPFLGVPTVAVAEQPEWNPLHEHVLRAALPQAAYVRATPDGASAQLSALRAREPAA